jgi:hypothetical protein
MMSLSETWAADEPAVPAHVVLRLDDFTEQLWGAFSQAIAAAGIDL